MIIVIWRKSKFQGTMWFLKSYTNNQTQKVIHTMNSSCWDRDGYHHVGKSEMLQFHGVTIQDMTYPQCPYVLPVQRSRGIQELKKTAGKTIRIYFSHAVYFCARFSCYYLLWNWKKEGLHFLVALILLLSSVLKIIFHGRCLRRMKTWSIQNHTNLYLKKYLIHFFLFYKSS